MRCPASPRLLLLVCVALGAAGCPTKYPACKTDQDCNQDKDRHEFCVNQQCQQCRDDKDCPAGKMCNKGRCDPIPGYCDTDNMCPPNTSCIEHRCRACNADTECGEGGRCRQGKCLRKGQCESDDDCPEDQDCMNGTCVGGRKAAAPPPRECTLAPIYFDFNEFTLTTDATDSIDKNAACIKRVDRVVSLVGRSDPRGTEEYNLALSEHRARQVKGQLERLGVSASKLHTLPKGELESNGKDEAGWAKDRRVDFEWQ